MERVNVTLSPQTILLRYCAFTLPRLHGDARTAELAERLAAAERELSAAIENHRTAVTELTTALAVRESRKHELDTTLRSVRLAVLADVHNNRRARLYRTVFSHGFIEILRGGPRHEVARSRRILHVLTRTGRPSLERAAKALRPVIDALDAAAEACDAAARARDDARFELGDAKERFARQYEQIYHLLVRLLGDWRLAGRYFPRFTKPKRG